MWLDNPCLAQAKLVEWCLNDLGQVENIFHDFAYYDVWSLGAAVAVAAVEFRSRLEQLCKILAEGSHSNASIDRSSCIDHILLPNAILVDLDSRMFYYTQCICNSFFL